MDGLKVAVTGSDDAAAREVADRLAELAAGAPVAVALVPAPEPGAHHLVVGVAVPEEDGTVDVRVSRSGEAVRELWEGRIAPFAGNLARRRRAPRRQQVVLTQPDPTWPAQAARLKARLARVLGERARRIDHIGSTSVPGMAAKDIIDLQVVVDDLATAVEAAALSHEAGFVHVAGPFYGIDRHGTHHDEQVAVDADPGRPVNVHVHPVSSPIWAEMLLLRDWLRADPAHRREYEAVKRELAARPGHDVNDYSLDKMPWISRALGRAQAWARRA
ncbi:GrpB family protein [Nonomuraea terrae]|uniref:GrpB family protein n=1 Tax=Nonomuraea terrae TaxID=2530383 RepID=UPI0037A4E3C9